MKKILLPAALLASCLSINAQADTVFGLYAGAYAWQADLSGDAVSFGTPTELNTFDDETATVVYVALEHPVPALPNIRLAQTGVEFEDANSTLDLTHTDVTLYYEVLDNIVSIDIGLAARMYDGEYVYTLSSYQSDIDNNQALAYAMVRGDLPFTGLALGAQLYAGQDSTTDVNVFLEYEMPIGLGFAAGYRALATEIETADKNNTADLDMDGGYLSVFFHL